MQGLSAVRRLLASCTNCRKQNACPGEQIMAPLLEARVAPPDPPFAHVGVGLLWPHLCKARTQWSKTLWMFVYMPDHVGSAYWSHTHVRSRLLQLCISAFCQLQRDCPRRYTATMVPISLAQNESWEKALERLDQTKVYNCLRMDNIQWSFNPPKAWQVQQALAASTMPSKPVLEDMDERLFTCTLNKAKMMLLLL